MINLTIRFNYNGKERVWKFGGKDEEEGNGSPNEPAPDKNDCR